MQLDSPDVISPDYEGSVHRILLRQEPYLLINPTPLLKKNPFLSSPLFFPRCQSPLRTSISTITCSNGKVVEVVAVVDGVEEVGEVGKEVVAVEEVGKEVEAMEEGHQAVAGAAAEENLAEVRLNHLFLQYRPEESRNR